MQDRGRNESMLREPNAPGSQVESVKSKRRPLGTGEDWPESVRFSFYALVVQSIITSGVALWALSAFVFVGNSFASAVALLIAVWTLPPAILSLVAARGIKKRQRWGRKAAIAVHAGVAATLAVPVAANSLQGDTGTILLLLVVALPMLVNGIAAGWLMGPLSQEWFQPNPPASG